MNTSKSNEWETPRWLFDRLNEIFHFEVDMACTPENQKCDVGIYENMEKHEKYDIIYDFQNYWCNPPYSDNGKSVIEKWVKNCLELIFHPNLSHKNKTLAMLIPVSTEMVAWHKYIWPHAKYLLFIKGRLKFEKNGIPEESSPKASALVVFTNHSYDLSSLSDLGQVIDMDRQRGIGGSV